MRVALWLLQDSIRNWNQWIAGFYYVKHCLSALQQLPAHECPEVVAFVPTSLRDLLLADAPDPLPVWLTIQCIEDSWLDSATGRKQIEDVVASHRCDVLFPAITPPMVPVSARVVGWIADFQHKHYPQFFSAEELAYRDRLFSFLSAIADTIVCSSDSVVADFRNFYRADETNAFVLRFTAQPPPDTFTVSDQGALQRLGITTPYAYLPYQFWIHKNHRIVFEAWKTLHDSGQRFTLVCSGAANDSRFPNYFRELSDFLAASGLTESVKILGLVDRRDQWQLYRNAKMIIQPSLFEGWSTSVEEARSLGKPVLLSDISVHREQADSWGHFFDPRDAKALSQKISQLWTQLPDGYDEAAERNALAANEARITAFGRELVKLFLAVASSTRPNIAEQVLPLFLYMQSEAQSRLAVIEELVAARDGNVTSRANNRGASPKSPPAGRDGKSWLSRVKSWVGSRNPK